jgi:hypothetical protein
MWDLHNSTLFPLIGVHATVDCAACHRPDAPFEYTSTSIDCLYCHVADYEQTTEPDHIRVGFPTECELCHTPVGWQPARLDGGAGFDHDSFFILSGAHRTLDCSACHRDGFGNTPTDCYSCHRDDYNSTRDPNHAASGFPTDCELCHNTNSWDDAEFIDHDALFFPIFSGKHRGEWDQCSDCHTVSSNFSLFECINCHEHRREEMDDKHEDEPGYVYQSTACLNCHPDGRE